MARKSLRASATEPRSLWGAVLVVGLVVFLALVYSFYSGWIVRMWLPDSTAWPSPSPTPVVTPVPAIG